MILALFAIMVAFSTLAPVSEAAYTCQEGRGEAAKKFASAIATKAECQALCDAEEHCAGFLFVANVVPGPRSLSCYLYGPNTPSNAYPMPDLEYCTRLQGCTGGKFKHLGSCVDTCPAGFYELGDGTTWPYCEARASKQCILGGTHDTHNFAGAETQCTAAGYELGRWDDVRKFTLAYLGNQGILTLSWERWLWSVGTSSYRYDSLLDDGSRCLNCVGWGDYLPYVCCKDAGCGSGYWDGVQCQGTTSSGNLAGDPVTYYNNLRIEFELPPEDLSLIIACPALHVLARPIPGSSLQEQWIDRVVMTTPSGERLIDIGIKPNLLKFNRSLLLPHEFETLDITMWDDQPGSKFQRTLPLLLLPPPDAYFWHENITINFARQRPGDYPHKEFPQRECAVAALEYLRVFVCSSSAHEYYGNGQEAWKFAHLDLDITMMRHDVTFTGILPELWGLSPLSQSTKSMVKTNSTQDNVSSDSCASMDKAPSSTVGTITV